MIKNTDIKVINDKILSRARKIRGYLYKQSTRILGRYKKRYYLIIQDNLVEFIDETLT
jgi:hypothetical protein